jgi:hypothetical protein
MLIINRKKTYIPISVRGIAVGLSALIFHGDMIFVGLIFYIKIYERYQT